MTIYFLCLTLFCLPVNHHYIYIVHPTTFIMSSIYLECQMRLVKKKTGDVGIAS